MRILHRKILCQLSYDTPDLICMILFICRRSIGCIPVCDKTFKKLMHSTRYQVPGTRYLYNYIGFYYNGLVLHRLSIDSGIVEKYWNVPLVQSFNDEQAQYGGNMYDQYIFMYVEAIYVFVADHQVLATVKPTGYEFNLQSTPHEQN